MRLSDYIFLGDSQKKCDSTVWLGGDGSCGCALGGALLAAGISAEQFRNAWYAAPYQDGYKEIAELTLIKQLWPWLTGEAVREISRQYTQVSKGEITIQQLCDYVRSIEPAEPEYEPEEEYWTDGKTEIERVNSIKGR